jgi:choline dehydrogenase-like flavoprotein
MSHAPVIDIGFLNDPQDLEDMVAGYKMTEKLMKAPAMAEWIEKDLFTADVKTDDDIRDILRKRTDTVYHPTGTCKMGTDAMSVVDPELKVYGIEGLRIVDGSAMPSLVGGNTNAPIVMMAEKAVDMIRGFSRVSPEAQLILATAKQSDVQSDPKAVLKSTEAAV